MHAPHSSTFRFCSPRPPQVTLASTFHSPEASERWTSVCLLSPGDSLSEAFSVLEIVDEGRLLATVR